jgi:hypothetical protein
MYHRQQFPIVVNMGNGLGKSLFLRVTQQDWSASPDSHSFEAHSCEQFRRMVRFGLVQDSHFLRKWSRQSFLMADSFSPGSTLFSAGGITQGGEWSRFSNQGQAFPRADSFSPGCTLFSARRMVWGGEWSRIRNQDSHSSFLEKNGPDSPSLMFYS